MKNYIIVTMCLAASVFSGCASARATSTEPSTGIKAAIASFAEAFQSGDYASVEAFIADDYVHVNSGGSPYTRGQWLNWYKGYAEEIASGDHVFSSYDIESLQITQYDDAAYVTGVVRASGTRLGETFTQNIRFTNLWVYESGQWKRAGFHDVASSK